MNKKDFDAKLKSLGISRQDFCNMTGLAYSSVANWKDESKPIPIWVDSWLENYKLAQKYKVIEELVIDKLSQDFNAMTKKAIADRNKK
ncbi:hypothetical protein LS68_009135 [Helicobacter sp. MIT 05-5293]|uniref:hypothetical protein n=1 Tax=unclassified Helicobacter TaxID=2593540 RepID=UPI00068C37A2|nr:MULTISPECIES: hypothetical protein [unclassified Helicobacter]TLD79827.1 hypothetical protein LS68_009135 [Helicobacter sp. MIT 05-5293]TLD85538.1 hypothetical protein LS69_009100 [Helicobacter sp. MIT 05-5294]